MVIATHPLEKERAMKKPTFRALSLASLLLAFTTTLHAQAGGGVTVSPPVYGPGVKPAIVKPGTPAIVTPGTPSVTRPGTPAIVRPGTPAVTHPASPGVITPGKPGIVYPPTPYPPGTVWPPGTVIVTTPGTVTPGPGYVTPVTPGYPSAWVGPTIIRETRTDLPPELIPTPNTGGTVQMPTLRLVSVVGALKRLHPASGADLGLAEAPLGVSVGMLVGYTQEKRTKAAGDFFGTCWDGPGCFAKSEDWRVGPHLDHPIMTVNELSPGSWEFEAGGPDRRIRWMRLAVTLFEDASQNTTAKPVNLPRGRRAAMREVLGRVTWDDKNVALKTPGVTEATALAGGDVSHFGKALATFAEKTMAPVPDNERIGIAEWYFPATDMGKLLNACPKFVAELPDGARLRATRAAAGGSSAPAWARPFEFLTDEARYVGELWFLIVADETLNVWIQK